MNDCVFALPAFLVLYIVFAALGCCPVTSAVMLTVAYISLSRIG